MRSILHGLGIEVERKIFFSEEKKQKTFMSLSRVYATARAIRRKSFLVLFFKKELLPCFFPCDSWSASDKQPRNDGVLWLGVRGVDDHGPGGPKGDDRREFHCAGLAVFLENAGEKV
jgi:hypothetical protein